MAAPFFERLRAYYSDVAAVLRGEASSAGIFPNGTDVGMSREQIYAEFLRQHAPSKCNIFLGGFLFGEDGSESKQLDVIITTDTAPRFDFHKRNGGKSFSPVEGTLGVASIKSRLDKAELYETLHGLAAIPPTASLKDRVPQILNIKGYDDWPYKIIYATAGISVTTLQQHLSDFYAEHPEVPLTRRPNVIHVSGQYAIMRAVPGMHMWDSNKGVREELVQGTFYPVITQPDLHALTWVLNSLQERALASTHIFFRYGEVLNRVLDVPPTT